MKRFLIMLGLVVVSGALLASTALAAAPAPSRSFNLGAWMKSRAGMTLAPAVAPQRNASVPSAAPTPGPTPDSADPDAGINGMMGGMMDGGFMMHADLEKLLGLSHQEIYSQMAAGKSLVEIAAAKGVSKDQLIKALLDGRRAALDQAVKDGRITQEQATTMLESMDQNIEAMVTAQGMKGMMQGAGPGAGSCPMHSRQGGQSSGQTDGASEPQAEFQQA